MRVVSALGGNALLRRGEELSAENQLIGLASVLTYLATELSPLQRIFDTVSLTSSWRA